jgi:hypothetical protein
MRISVAGSSSNELREKDKGVRGYRVLLAYRRDIVAVFLYGFAKNERENISRGELAAMHELAKWWLRAGAAQWALAIEEGVVQEVRCEDEE